VRRLLVGEPVAEACAASRRSAEARGAASVSAWIAAVEALAAAAEGAPDARDRARAAAAAGRGSGVRGVQALIALALAATPPSATAPPSTAGSAAATAAAQARELAAEHGLPWPAALERRLLGPPAPEWLPLGPTEPATSEPTAAGAGAAVVAGAVDPPLVVRCFGGFEIAVGGRTLDPRTVRPRAAATLRLLAARAPQPLHRDSLLTLWPDLPTGQATHSLQVAISSLRAFLAPGAPRGSARMIDRVGSTYALALPPGSRSDVLDLDAALAAADRSARACDPGPERAALATALATYRGDLLPEDGDAEWVVADREQWRSRVTAATARLTVLHLATGDPRAAVDAARRGLEIDPFCDPLWRALIAGHARTGDTAAQARARHGYTAVLSELGIAPGAEPRPPGPRTRTAGPRVPQPATRRAPPLSASAAPRP
jgi:DNA-binding SARP family transcriptional activator